MEITSSDSRTFFVLDIPWLIEPIRKLLIEMDLSESTSIVFLKGWIFWTIERLKLLDVLIDKRRKLADVYFEKLKILEEKGMIELPPKYSTNSSNISTFQNFEIKAKSRNELIDYLKINKISTIKQWGGFSIAHFSKLGYNLKDFPSTKSLFDKLLLLPLNHMMSSDEVEFVCKKILDFYY